MGAEWASCKYERGEDTEENVNSDLRHINIDSIYYIMNLENKLMWENSQQYRQIFDERINFDIIGHEIERNN